MSVTYGKPYLMGQGKNFSEYYQQVFVDGKYMRTEAVARIRRIKSKAGVGKPMHNQYYYKVTDAWWATGPSPLFTSHDEALNWLIATKALG